MSLFESKNKIFITKLIEEVVKNKVQFKGIDSPEKFSNLNSFLTNLINNIGPKNILDGSLHYLVHINELLNGDYALLYTPEFIDSIYFPRNKIIVSMKISDKFINKKDDILVFAICFDIKENKLTYYSYQNINDVTYFNEVTNNSLHQISKTKLISAEKIIADIMLLPHSTDEYDNEKYSNTIRCAIGYNFYDLVDLNLLKTVLSLDDDPFSGHCIWCTEIVENYYRILELFSNLALSYYTPNPEKVDYYMQGFFEFHNDYVMSSFWPVLNNQKIEDKETCQFGVVMNRKTKELRFFKDRKNCFLSQTSFILEEINLNGSVRTWFKEDITKVYDENKDPIDIFARNVWYLLDNEELIKSCKEKNPMFLVEPIKIK